MTKLSTVTLFIAIIIIASSCARILRPGTGNAKNNKRNTNKTAGNKNNNAPSTTTTANVTTLKNIVFSTAANANGVNQKLALDVYKPADAAGKKFPAIFLIHGGGFVNGDKNSLTSTSSKLAANGYVVVSLNYRLGFGKNGARSNCADSNLLKQALYRSVEDAYEAINYVVQRADDYNVDNNWIFIGGQSAGAITALSTAYFQNDRTQRFFSSVADQSATFNAAKNGFTIRGVISMWGAFLDPGLITAKTALPTIFFQGERDNVVPFNTRPFAPCAVATPIYGTRPLYTRLKNLGVTAIAHVDPQGGHGVFTEDFRIKNILCFLNDVRQGTVKQVYLTGVQNSCGN